MLVNDSDKAFATLLLHRTVSFIQDFRKVPRALVEMIDADFCAFNGVQRHSCLGWNIVGLHKTQSEVGGGECEPPKRQFDLLLRSVHAIVERGVTEGAGFRTDAETTGGADHEQREKNRF